MTASKKKVKTTMVAKSDFTHLSFVVGCVAAGVAAAISVISLTQNSLEWIVIASAFAALSLGCFVSQHNPAIRRFSARDKDQLLMQVVLSHVKHGLVVLDNEGRVVVANPIARELFNGVKPGADFAKFSYMLGYRNVNDLGVTSASEVLRIPADSKSCLTVVRSPEPVVSGYFTLHAAVIAHEGQEALGKVISCHSVTDLVRSRDSLKTLAAEQRVAAHLDVAFLRNLRHEIYTPLNDIMGHSDRLVGHASLAETPRAHAHAVRESARVTMNRLDNIFDYTLIEDGGMELEAKTIDFSKFIADVFAMIKSHATVKPVVISLEYCSAMPAMIETDPDRLRRILLNVVGNAVKFTRQGRICIKIDYESTAETEAVLRFIISDTGCGISERDRTEIFEPKAKSTAKSTEVYGGLGIGLLLSRRLARLMGGDVVIQSSEVGKGSTFVVTVQTRTKFQANLIQALSPMEDSLDVSPSEIYPECGLEGRKILVVDDCKVNTDLLRYVLTTAGATVESSDNGLGAVEKVLNGHYDIVLMDLRMPVMDGYEAMTVFREHGISCPVIALTAHSLPTELDRCLSLGFVAHLNKPVNPDILVTTIKRLLSPLTHSADSRPQSEGGTEAIDLAVYQRAPARVKELILSYLASLPDWIAMLRHAHKESEWDRVSFIAHKIAGTAGGCGLPRHRQVATEIMDALDANAATDALTKKFDELEQLNSEATRDLSTNNH